MTDTPRRMKCTGPHWSAPFSLQMEPLRRLCRVVADLEARRPVPTIAKANEPEAATSTPNDDGHPAAGKPAACATSSIGRAPHPRQRREPDRRLHQQVHRRRVRPPRARNLTRGRVCGSVRATNEGFTVTDPSRPDIRAAFAFFGLRYSRMALGPGCGRRLRFASTLLRAQSTLRSPGHQLRPGAHSWHTHPPCGQQHHSARPSLSPATLPRCCGSGHARAGECRMCQGQGWWGEATEGGA